MTPKEIKVVLLERDLTISGLARDFGCDQSELSRCIHRNRVYPELRKKLARRLRIPVQRLFGEGAESNTKAA